MKTFYSIIDSKLFCNSSDAVSEYCASNVQMLFSNKVLENGILADCAVIEVIK